MAHPASGRTPPPFSGEEWGDEKDEYGSEEKRGSFA